MTTAVLVVDMINDFVHGKAPSLPATPHKDRVVSRCVTAVRVAREARVPVVYTSDRFAPHEMPTTVEFKVWGEHAISGTEGAEIIEELRPASSDFVIHKKRYSAFPGTQLDLLLRELTVTEVAVIGIQTDCCVQHTVWDAFVRSYSTVVLQDACDAPDSSEHDRALAYMTKFYATRVIEVEDWSQELAARLV